ncbi:MAG: DnaJ domain-containing protein [Actinomycetota bacterium]|nr:DnaJ domain-containing protein [Actinomycetota bacterium]
MKTRDLYKVLGVSKGASQDEIRSSYRKLARESHPDANPDDSTSENRFKEIQHAYEVLSNPEKRREYDEGPRSFLARPAVRKAERGANLGVPVAVSRTSPTSSIASVVSEMCSAGMFAPGPRRLAGVT